MPEPLPELPPIVVVPEPLPLEPLLPDDEWCVVAACVVVGAGDVAGVVGAL